MHSGNVFVNGGRSLKHIMKTNGPNIDAWRSSIFYCSKFEKKKNLVSLRDFISSLSFLFVTQDLNHFASFLECHKIIIHLARIHELHSQKPWQIHFPHTVCLHIVDNKHVKF